MRYKSNKGLGQVFLKNQNIKKKIAELANTSKYKNILEIGPGLGAITKFVDFDNKNYLAIEIDIKLVSFLREEFPKANIIPGDFLSFDIKSLNINEEMLLFGNIPYYISTPILLVFLNNNLFPEFYLMVQKEYFQMLSASFKSNEYSSFSVLIQTFCKVEKLFDIGRQNFFPKPKIDSVFLSLVKIKKHHLDVYKYSLFLRICFSMPRKTLYNNLRKHIDTEKVLQIFKDNQLPENIRAEEISPKKFEEIFTSIVSWIDLTIEKKTKN